MRGFLFLVLCTVAGSAFAYDTQTWRFKASVGERDIGEHTFTVVTEAGAIQVVSQAEFAVKLLFIKAFGYSHEARERYEGGCLRELASTTDTQGEVTRVTASSEGNVLTVRNGDEFASLRGCYLGFSYWNPDLLEQSRLINPQTGELVEVEIIPQGLTRFAGFPAKAYRLRAPELDIGLWYDEQDGRWLGLESTLEDGRVLRYEPLAGQEGR